MRGMSGFGKQKTGGVDMKKLLLVAVVLLTTSGAFAGGNPDVVAYIDFDPPNRVHEFTPVLYEQFSAYVCFGDLEDGLTCVSYGINDLNSSGLVGVSTFMNLLAGLWIGCDTGSLVTGCTFFSEFCLPGTDVCAARIDVFYLGGSFCIEILDHAWYPRQVCDCGDPVAFDTYCVLSNGSVAGGACPEGDCWTAVEDGTWGAMKSLYR